MLRADKIAVIGDLHGRYNALDNAYLERAGFDLVLFVGDLGSGTLNNGLELIRLISRLRVPGLVMPGNNDAPHLAQLKAELTFQSGKSELFRLMGPTRRKGVTPCGYSVHEIETAYGGVSLIAGRPCARGGSEFSFQEQIERDHKVSGIAGSEQRLCDLVDEAQQSDIIFLAHNGPFGLGTQHTDLWSRDFEIETYPDAPLDWGDEDLAGAIAYAKVQGKRVISVVAGHMHRAIHSERQLAQELGGTMYINAAVTPRIRMNGENEEHHCVELNLDLRAENPIVVSEHWVNLESG